MMLEAILSQFSIPGVLGKTEKFSSGLINDTFLCEFLEDGRVRKYVLQHINKSVFKHPELVMRNVAIVTAHIVHRLRAQGVEDPEAVTPALIATRKGPLFHFDDAGEYWRVFHFIESGAVFDTVTGPDHAREVGRALGRFQSLLSDLSPRKLSDTLPGFHYTPLYLRAFDDALRSDAKGRVREVAAEAEFINARRSRAPLLMDLMNSGRIPLRVVHNDPKVNNVLVHATTGKAVCMIDLDTVKPGIVHFDFGDCVRSAANPSGEDAADLSKVGLDLRLFEALAGGYLSEAGPFLTQTEKEMLPASVNIITFELGIRFLTDYLQGDRYFKINNPTHNLHRARVQFRLLESIEHAAEKMASLVRDFSAEN